MLAVQSREPEAPLGAQQVRPRLLGQRQEAPRVAVAYRLRVGAGGELLQRELADRLEHDGARPGAVLLLADQALVDQRLQSLQHVDAQLVAAADRLDVLQLGAPREHREAREQAPPRLVEQIVAPRDRAPQRLLPVGEIARARLQQAEAALQPRQDRRGRQQLDARRGQLDRQRQPVQAGADLGDRRGVVVGDLESRLDRERPLDEQPDRLVLRHTLGGRARIGEHQRRHRHLLLARDAKRAARRRDHLQARAGADQIGDQRRGGQHLLEVVHHQQRLPIAQVLHQPVPRRALPGLQVQGVDDRGRHQIGVDDRRERDEGDAAREAIRHLRRDLQRQARLAGAARAGQRQHARLLEQPHALGDLALAPDEAGHLHGQVVGDGVQAADGREVARQAVDDQLQHAFGAAEVLEPVLAEIAQRDARRERVAHEQARRLGQQHLTAVTGVRDPRRAVDVVADVVSAGGRGAQAGLAGVQPHPHADDRPLGEHVRCERALRRDDRRDRRRGALEHVEEAVPFHAHPVSALGVERARDQPAVIFQDGVEARLAQRLHQPGRALDVREHERQRACGQRRARGAHELTAPGAGAP